MTIESGGASIGGATDPASLRRAQAETIKAVIDAFANAAATTDPGASPTLQGAGRSR